MMKKTVIVLAALLLSSTLLISALGKEGGVIPEREKHLLMPIAEALSGPVWLRLKELDPIHAANDYKGSPSETAQPPGGAVMIPYREPSPRFSRNIIVSHDIGRYPYQTEPHIAFNPTSPDKLVVGLIDYNVDGVAAYSSIDGGETWEGPMAMKPLQGDYFGADPVVGFSRDGTAYFAYLSVGTRPVRVGNIVLIAEIGSIVVSNSVDEGRTWSDPVMAAAGTARWTEEGVVVSGFLDKPWMTIGPDPKNPDQDNIYVTYTEFMQNYPLIEEYPYVLAPTIEITVKLARSTDGGATFSPPVAVSPTYSYPSGIEERRIVQGSLPAVAPDGKLYVAYYDSLDDGPWKGLFAPMVTWSVDGGQSFTKAVAIDHLSETDYILPPSLFRAWSSMFPQMAVGPEGTVYVVFAANPTGPDDSDIYFTRSLDDGRTWSRVKKINDDLTTHDQFFPALATDKRGNIHVIFGDKRDDPNDVQYHIYYTNSSDGGLTWGPNGRVSDSPSNPNYGIPFFIGDYFAIAASDEDVNIVWTDTRLGKRAPNEAIAFARKRFVSSPSIFLSPPSGSAGTSVTIMGFNFAPRLREVYIEVEGAIVSSVLTNDEGRFTTTLFVPISGEGSHTIRAMDVSGNIAEATFYTEFGFDTVRDEFRKTFGDIEDRLTIIEQGIEEVNIDAIKTNVQRLQDEVKTNTQKLEEQLSSIEREVKEVDTETIETDIQKLEVSLGSFSEAFRSRLDDLERNVNTQISGITNLLWTAIALAVISIVISVSAVIVLLRRLR